MRTKDEQEAKKGADFHDTNKLRPNRWMMHAELRREEERRCDIPWVFFFGEHLSYIQRALLFALCALSKAHFSTIHAHIPGLEKQRQK